MPRAKFTAQAELRNFWALTLTPCSGAWTSSASAIAAAIMGTKADRQLIPSRNKHAKPQMASMIDAAQNEDKGTLMMAETSRALANCTTVELPITTSTNV